jgi:hypothetical protein
MIAEPVSRSSHEHAPAAGASSTTCTDRFAQNKTLVFGPRSRPREEFLDRKNGMVRCPDP